MQRASMKAVSRMVLPCMQIAPPFFTFFLLFLSHLCTFLIIPYFSPDFKSRAHGGSSRFSSASSSTAGIPPTAAEPTVNAVSGGVKPSGSP